MTTANKFATRRIHPFNSLSPTHEQATSERRYPSFFVTDIDLSLHTISFNLLQAQIATLKSLKQSLRQKVEATPSTLKQPLSDVEYSAAFEAFVQDEATNTYSDFIIPQISCSESSTIAHDSCSNPHPLQQWQHHGSTHVEEAGSRSGK
jgi:hypothetical protein